MTLDIILILSIATLMVLFFVLELLPVEAIGLSVMVALMVLGLVSPEEGISGFSNHAVITIMALMIIGAGLEETGAVQTIGYQIKELFYLPEWISVALLMLIAATISAFINTTAVVIIFLSVLLKLADKIPANLSKLLIPLSFASILGGSCSLMGTSTNLLVSSISAEAGFESFGFFEFTPIGAGIFLVAFVYMVLIGRLMLPEKVARKKEEEALPKKLFTTVITVDKGSALSKEPIQQTIFSKNDNLTLIAVGRDHHPFKLAGRYKKLKTGDRLLIHANAEGIKEILQDEMVTLLDEEAAGRIANDSGQSVLCEALIKPSSDLIGQPLDKTDLWKKYKVITIGTHEAKKTADVISDYFSPAKALKIFMEKDTIEMGDTLLVMAPRNLLEELSNTRDFVLLREFRELSFKTQEIFISLSILAGVIVLAATGVVPNLVSALAGALVMVLTGCIPLKKALRNVNWNILFLLAGMIPIGIAMKNTGADHFLANVFVDVLPSQKPLIVIGFMFLWTAILSSVLSNNATAILLAPIAISLSEKLGFPVKPLLFAVMFGANTSYFTPLGYQTNTLIYNPGNYKFSDFFRVGGLLTLIICVAATFLIYWFAY